MIATQRQRTWTVALVGNPNTGKSTLFNALCGLQQRVGNFPGVTVEKKYGRFTVGNRQIELIDLPGTYSLAVRSADELEVLDVLVGRTGQQRPDAIVCVVDANNLERNLFLVSQLMHLGVPVLIALNMTDVALRNGVEIDVPALHSRLGIPVIPIQANKRRGLQQLKDAVAALCESTAPSCPSVFPENFVNAAHAVSRQLGDADHQSQCFLAQRLLLDPSGELLQRIQPHPELSREVEDQTRRLTAEGLSLVSLEATGRYRWIEDRLSGIVRRPSHIRTASDRLDAVLTSRRWGIPIFAVVILIVFQAVFSWAQPLMAGVEWIFASIGAGLERGLPSGIARSLVVDGVVAGVGGVLVFLPQILILFFFIALLEDCGYLARASYLMDKSMTRFGLSGKSFIPLLSSFACAIPGIMATRIIENRRDRLITILVAPLMSCSARLPVYTLLIAAFIPQQVYLGGLLSLPAMVLFAMYALGIVVAVPVALLLRRTILRGQTPPFVMELPEYKVPSLRVAVARMWERGWAFVRRAGTIIVSVSILVWAAASFPRHSSELESIERDYAAQIAALDGGSPQAANSSLTSADLQQRRDRELAAAQMRNSVLGKMGHWLEPAVEPLGWDWRIASAVVASFPAREVVVAALGVIYSLGEDQDESSASLKEQLRRATRDGTDQPVYNVPVALSLLVFFALCAQCASTLVIIRRETRRWGWALFSFAYMTILAYVAALVTYQVGMWLSC
jgi:ferrous iron transport protein B